MKPLVLVTALAVMLTACKRQQNSSVSTGTTVPDQTSNPQTAGPPGPPTQAPQETVVVSENADVSATLSDLSQELRVYISQTRSAPKDYDDFVARAHVQAPPPPAGQAYAISRGKVVLVKR
jgi:hypothetical protein